MTAPAGPTTPAGDRDATLGRAFGRVLDRWAVTRADAARMLGVSRDDIDSWIRSGVPMGLDVAIGHVVAADELLVRHRVRGRVAAVVRRPWPQLGGAALIDLFATGATAELLAATRRMFTCGPAGT